jgi:hypothetical protein
LLWEDMIALRVGPAVLILLGFINPFLALLIRKFKIGQVGLELLVQVHLLINFDINKNGIV